MRQNHRTVDLEPLVDFIRENVGDDNLIEAMGAEACLENIDIKVAAEYYGTGILDYFDIDEIKNHLDLVEA